MPESCVYQATGTHYFRAHGDYSAKAYLCPLAELPKMTCYFYQSPDGYMRELQCENTNDANPESKPADCVVPYSGGYRVFFDGRLRSSDGAACASRFQLTCDYFRHRPDGTGMDNADNLLCR